MKDSARSTLNAFIRLVHRHPAWLFPFVLTALLLILTVCGISGSSLGTYDSLFGQKSHTIVGQPRTVRSDEWLVNTPLIISQARNHFKLHNPDIGTGSDMAITVDVPYKDWSMVFKPQNLVFFVLPLAMAFAFKWWFLSYVVLLAVYWLSLKLFPKRLLLAVLLSVAFLFSPFIQWWYQTITLLTVAYAIFTLLIGLRLVESRTTRQRLGWAGALIYAVVCFSLLLYPPFQICVALVVLAIFLALYLQKKLSWRQVGTDVAWLAGAGIVILAIIGAFILSHRSGISAELHTVYPGDRSVAPGGFSVAYFAGWPLSYVLQQNVNLFGNQSESSNFLLFGLLLFPLVCFLAGKQYYRSKSRRIETQSIYVYLLIALGVVLCLFLARLFVPFGSTVYKLFGLSSVPLNRMFIGIGIINVVLLGLAVIQPFGSDSPFRGWKSVWSVRAATMGLLTVIYCVVVLKLVAKHYGIPVGIGRFELAGLSIICALCIALLSHEIMVIRYAGLTLAVLIGLYSSARVNPLYHGLGSINASPLISTIRADHTRNPQAAWIVSDRTSFEALPVSIGAHSYSGVYPYPQKALWAKYFPGSANSFVYNRFAHVEFSVDDMVTKPTLQLIQGDTFEVHINSCDPMLRDLQINYILTTDVLNHGYNCFTLDSTTYAGPTGIFIYRRH